MQPVYMTINNFTTCGEAVSDFNASMTMREIAADQGRNIGQIKGQDKSNKASIFCWNIGGFFEIYFFIVFVFIVFRFCCPISVFCNFLSPFGVAKYETAMSNIKAIT